MYWRAAALLERSRIRLHKSLAVNECFLQLGRGIVSFTFDDFPRSAYLIGGAVLQKHGAQGTYYAALSLMSATTDLGQHFTPDDVRHLLADGHELGCHTFSHLSCSHNSAGAIEADLRKNQAELNKIVPDYHLNQFAYPYGHVSVRAKRIAGRFFRASRSTYPGINTNRSDLNLLLAARLYSRIPWTHIRNLISEMVASHGWLIFFTHDVEQHPSPYGCTRQYLEDAIKCVLESGAQILTVGEVLVGTGRRPV
jgi:peptidoglycan/xylan/chitin deacetylase (PgdA/CDA1 family)